MKKRLLIFSALLAAVCFPVHETMAQRGDAAVDLAPQSIALRR